MSTWVYLFSLKFLPGEIIVDFPKISRRYILGKIVSDFLTARFWRL